MASNIGQRHTLKKSLAEIEKVRDGLGYGDEEEKGGDGEMILRTRKRNTEPGEYKNFIQ